MIKNNNVLRYVKSDIDKHIHLDKNIRKKERDYELKQWDYYAVCGTYLFNKKQTRLNRMIGLNKVNFGKHNMNRHNKNE